MTRKLKKKMITGLVLAIFLITNVFADCGAVFAAAAERKPDREKIQVIVKMKDDTDLREVMSSVRQKTSAAKLESRGRVGRVGMELLEIDAADNLEQIIEELKSNPDVEYAQANHRLYSAEAPADALFGQQWGLANTGQTVDYRTGTVGVDINALNAWEITQGASAVVVGVLDTGIDIGHSDLADNIYVNQGEVPGNGIDDDGNGYVDDCRGWDFANWDNSVYDGATADRHGTQVAGIIAAKADVAGIVGVAPNVKLLPLKFMSGSSGYTSDAIEAIEYARQMGVRLINCSFGGTEENPALYDAMAESGILFVCAAGNSGNDVATNPVYPACFDLPNIISVAAIDNTGALAGFSNYGAAVDVAAPGVSILSTAPGGGYETTSGTSAAAAYVTGIAALLKSDLPQFTAGEIAARVKANAETAPALAGKVNSGGWADAYFALANTTIPEGEEEPGEPPGGEPTGDGTLTTMAAEIDPLLLEQIHFGEDGVNPATGNFSRTYTDMTLESPGFQINISRTYNSKDDRTDTLLGLGWTFGFEGSFKQEGTSSVWLARLPNGSVQTFIKDGTAFTANDSRSTMTQQGGSYVLMTKDQYAYTFNSNGWLVEMKDRNGNAITVGRDTQYPVRITTITDHVGRQFSIAYNAQGRIISVTNPVGENVTYGYTASLLSSVTDPMGKVCRYEYDSFNKLHFIKDTNSNVLETIDYSYDGVGRIYALGGYNGAYLNTAETYSPHNDTWVSLPNMPTARRYLGAAAYGQTVYAIGGYNGSNRNTVEAYNPSSNTWSSKVSMPTARYGMGVATVGSKIYAIGGYGGTYSNLNEEYNCVMNTWTTKAVMPTARRYLGAAEANGMVYAVGGATGSTTYSAKNEEYNPIANSWTTKADLPIARAQLAVVSVNGKVYAIGGYNGSALSDVHEYNPVSNAWTAKQSMPDARYDMGAAALNGKIYIFGGQGTGDGRTLEYDPQTNAWTPKTAMPTAGRYGLGAAAGTCVVSSHTNIFDNTYTYTYDVVNRCTTIVDSNGRETKKWYDSGFSITQSRDPESRNTYVEYFVDANGYNQYGEEKSIIDRNGNKTQYERDGNGNITRIINPDGSERKYAYDDKNNLIKEEDEEGKATYYVYDSNKVDVIEKAQAISSSGAYSQYGDQTDFSVVRYAYYSDAEAQSMGCQAKGLLKSEADPLGRITSYVYDQYANEIKIIDPDGNVTVKSYTKDGVANYDRLGWVTSIASPEGYKTEYTYDDCGRVEKIVAHGGETTRITYDVEGRKTKEIEPNQYDPTLDNIASHTYSGNHGIRYTYFNSGKLRTITDQSENITTYAYDCYGNVVTEEKPYIEGSPYNAKYLYRYDAVNRLKGEYGPSASPWAVTVAGGESHTLQLSIHGDVYSNGLNNYGQLGDGTITNSVTPVKVSGLTGVNMVAAGLNHNLALKNNGTVWAWGYNAAGRLGDGTSTDRTSPVQVVGLSGVIYIACGFNNSFAIKDDGTAWAWGYNGLGQLGDGTSTSRYAPVQVSGLTGVTGIAGGEYHGLAVKSDGTVWTWGYNSQGQLGDGTTTAHFTPAQVPGLTGITAVSAGKWHCLALKNDGTVWAWGNNIYGQIGDGSTSTRLSPVQVFGLSGVIAIAAGELHSLALKNDGTAWSWGCNSNGQLGDGTTTTRRTPVSTDLTDITAISARYSHSLAVKNDGTVMAWGCNTNGQLGNGSTTDCTTPTPVAGSNEIYIDSSITYNTDGTTQKIVAKHLNATDTAVTTSTYDYAGRLIKQVNPDGGAIVNTYYRNGKLKSATDPNGGTTFYQYDGLNRLTGKWSPAESGRYSYTGIEYNKAGDITAEKTGKVPVGAYDVPAASELRVKSYEYYPTGKLKCVKDSTGGRTEYQYDRDGNLTYECVYTGETTGNVTKYKNNHLGKPVEKTVPVAAGDIDGNYFDSTSEVELKTVYTYDKNGNLETITTPDGATATYGYDNLDRLTSVSKPGTDEYGNKVMVETRTTYNWQGNPLTVQDAIGSITEYTYNNRGFLTLVHQVTLDDTLSPVHHYTAYEYDLAGRIITEVSPESYIEGQPLSAMNRTEYTYDGMDRLKVKTEVYRDPVTGEWTTLVSKAFKYDKNGNMIKELDGEGYLAGAGTTADARIESGYGTLYRYDYANRLSSVLDPVGQDRNLPYTARYTYDGAGRKESETNGNGGVLFYHYDDAGNLTAVAAKKSVSDPEQVMKEMEYDLAGNMTSLQDASGNATVFEYNAFNQVRKITYPGDDTIPEYSVTFQYDAMGSLAEKLSSTGTVDRYTYDAQGRELTHTQARAAGGESITTTQTYDRNGNIRFATDGNGVQTEYVYDGLNRLTEEAITATDLSGNETVHTTSYAYDKNGSLLTETDWLGNAYEYIYDPLNRLIEKRDPFRTIQTLAYNASHLQVNSWDAYENETTFAYDKNNRLIATTDPEEHTERQDYDNAGNLAKQVDGRGNTTLYRYDFLNRLARVTNAKGEVTAYTYDLNGNLLTQTDGNGNTTTYEYNARNKPVRRIDSGGRTGSPGKYVYDLAKTESYTYHADGNLATKLDRNGNTTEYTYDSHGRMLAQAVGGQRITYTYDNNGNTLTVTNETGTTRRVYDKLNRAVTKTESSMGTSTCLYDITDTVDGVGVPVGHVAEKITDPTGYATVKVYDEANRLETVTVWEDAAAKTTTYAYDDNGNRARVTYPGGQIEEYEYYDDNLLMTLTNREAGGSVYDTYYYEYDAAHNQTKKVDAKGETLYEYDALNRLAGVTEPDGKLTEYEYDAAGNRTLERVTVGEDVTSAAYTYNEQNRLLTTVQVVGLETRTTAYTYDNNGNLTYKADEITRKIDPANPPTPHFGMFISGQADDPATPQNDAATEYALDMLMSTAYYTYDGFNQLIKSTQGNSTIAYRYNGEGLRVEKTVNDEATRFVYDDGGHVILETTARGITTARNVYGINLLARIADGQTAYYFYNGHADVVALFGENGTVLATYYYDAFGNILEETGSFNNPYRYAGYQYDIETKLYYLQSRMYDPALARFLQEDSFRGRQNDPLSLNHYTYCHNNPITYWDPTGSDLVPLRENVEAAGGTVTYNDKTGDAKFTVGNYTVTVNVKDAGVSMINGRMHIDESKYGAVFGLNATSTVKTNEPDKSGTTGAKKSDGGKTNGSGGGSGSGSDAPGGGTGDTSGTPEGAAPGANNNHKDTGNPILPNERMNAGLGTGLVPNGISGSDRGKGLEELTKGVKPTLLNQLYNGLELIKNPKTWEGLWNKYFGNKDVDYYMASISAGIPNTFNVVGIGGQVILDKNGNLYFGPNLSLAKTIGKGAASLVAGQFKEGDSLNESQLKSNLSGLSGNASAGAGFGAGTTTPLPNKGNAAKETGAYTPQVGVSLGYSWHFIDITP